jgi:ABC-type uncharacterized transport system permease subunit
MIVELIIGIAVVCAALYLLLRYLEKPLFFEKRIRGGKSVVVVRTNKPLKRVTVTDKADNEKLTFVRNNVGKGEFVEFIYHASPEDALLIVDDDVGTHTFKIPLIKQR